MRWLVIGAACAVALVAYLLGGLVMSSAANRAARWDLLAGRLMWAFAAALFALAVYAVATRSSMALKVLTGVVVAAGVALGVLFASFWVTNHPRR